MVNNISEYVLNYSLSKRCPVAIMYMKDSEITHRNVRVMKMNKDIIKAIDINKNAIRTFKKENILSAMRLNK